MSRRKLCSFQRAWCGIWIALTVIAVVGSQSDTNALPPGVDGIVPQPQPQSLPPGIGGMFSQPQPDSLPLGIDGTVPLPQPGDVLPEGRFTMETPPGYQPEPEANDSGEQLPMMPDAPGFDDASNAMNYIEANERTQKSGVCASQMTGKVTWALATAGGRNCQAACKGMNGAGNSGLIAINAGTASAPSNVCRTYSSVAGAIKAGFSQAVELKASPCYAFKAGMTIVAGIKMDCACVADTNAFQYSGCPRPQWKVGTGELCTTVCESTRRSDVKELGPDSASICLDEVQTRVGFLGQYGKTPSCFFGTTEPPRTGQGPPVPLSVLTSTYRCLCI